MSAKEEFKKLYSRYLKKFFINIALQSALISLSILLALTVVFWIIGFKYFWIAFIVFAVVYGASFLTLYLIKKPSEKEFFMTLEDMGLEQRAITMYEYMEDDSLIAKLQRENAKENIKNKDYKSLKISVSVALLSVVGVIFAASAGTSVAAGLSANRIIPSVGEAIAEIQEEKEFEIEFKTDGCGVIEGDIFQVVKAGEDALGVNAIPEDGWYFYSWGVYDEKYGEVITDDMNQNKEDHDPYREVTNVDRNYTYYAVFKELEDDQNNDGDSDDSDSLKRPEDEKPQKPTDSQQGSSDQNSEGGGEGGYKKQENNQVIDGETYYGDAVFDNAYSDAMEQIQGEEGNSNSEINKIINDYYETIEK